MKGYERQIRTGSNADIAFAIVVLASYFATFSSIRQASAVDIFLLVILGIIYIGVGIYGYSYAQRTDILLIRAVYFLVQIPLGGLIVGLGKGAGFNALILLPLAGQAVVLLSEVFSYLANLSVIAIYLLAVRAYSSGWDEVWTGVPIFFAGLIFIVVFTQAAVAEETARKEVERLVIELREANIRLRDYSIRVEEMAIIEERNRLAREIHDGLGHYLTTINIQLEAAQAIMEKQPMRARAMVQKAAGLVVDALHDVRQSVAALRTEPQIPALTEAISVLLKDCAGIKTSLVVKGEAQSLPTYIQHNLYRIVQEALSNIVKHSQASVAEILLDFTDSSYLMMQISDNGIGSNLQAGGYGLINVKERVGLLNGSLEVISTPGKGFSLCLRVPYE